MRRFLVASSAAGEQVETAVRLSSASFLHGKDRSCPAMVSLRLSIRMEREGPALSMVVSRILDMHNARSPSYTSLRHFTHGHNLKSSDTVPAVVGQRQHAAQPSNNNTQAAYPFSSGHAIQHHSAYWPLQQSAAVILHAPIPMPRSHCRSHFCCTSPLLAMVTGLDVAPELLPTFSMAATTS
jgi:hypothetical protein